MAKVKKIEKKGQIKCNFPFSLNRMSKLQKSSVYDASKKTTMPPPPPKYTHFSTTKGGGPGVVKLLAWNVWDRGLVSRFVIHVAKKQNVSIFSFCAHS